MNSGTTTITATDSSGASASTTLTVSGQTNQFFLSVFRAGAGAGSVSSNPPGISCGTDCSEAYNSGTSVTLTATAAAGSTFAGWSGCDTVSGATCTVTMNAARIGHRHFHRRHGEFRPHRQQDGHLAPAAAA